MESENKTISGSNTSVAENNMTELTKNVTEQILMESENNKLSRSNTSIAENNMTELTKNVTEQKTTEMAQGTSACSPWSPFKSIQEILSSLKSKKVPIQLYCAHKSDMTNYAMQELRTKLESQQFRDSVRPTVKICEDIHCIKSNIHLIVVCLLSTRLSEDLRIAIAGVQPGSNTVVLIFHHLKPHALPTESSYTILTKEVNKEWRIIDVAFFETMGLYECDMNKKAYKNLIKFFNKDISNA